MIDMRLRALQRNFFDRPEVMRRLGAAKRKVLNEAGRMVRRRAQASLKYGDEPSRPGSPPTAHRSRTSTRKSRSTGRTRKRSVSFLREFLYYAYDPNSESVVVGPAQLNTVTSRTALPALEYGGPSVIVNTYYRGGKKLRERRSIRVKARPFMAPAYEAERENINALWRDSIR